MGRFHHYEWESVWFVGKSRWLSRPVQPHGSEVHLGLLRWQFANGHPGCFTSTSIVFFSKQGIQKRKSVLKNGWNCYLDVRSHQWNQINITLFLLYHYLEAKSTESGLSLQLVFLDKYLKHSQLSFVFQQWRLTLMIEVTGVPSRIWWLSCLPFTIAL